MTGIELLIVAALVVLVIGVPTIVVLLVLQGRRRNGELLELRAQLAARQDAA